MNSKSIWDQKQNKPTLVVKDIINYLRYLFAYELPDTYSDWLYNGKAEHIIYTILLRRGVFKWLAVRRQLITLKNTWKSRITRSQCLVETYNDLLSIYPHNTKVIQSREFQRGYMAAYQEARKEVRALCHSERWQCPDFDKEAERWLDGQENIKLEELGLE